jgi:succinate dehydrogenase / fumarate reductase, membrane anchor subunit
MELGRYSRARPRPTGSRREVLVWYMMRITGVMLFVLALAHFSIYHFIWDPAEQTAEFIIEQRWNQLIWRGYTWLMLMTVLFHGWLGVRTVVLDYLHRPRLRTGTLWLLYVLGVVLLVIGTQVLFATPMPETASAARP